MRHVGDLPSEELAQRFVDCMRVRDLKTQCDQEEDAWAIWAIEEDDFDFIKEELATFREAPDAEQYRGHSSQATKLRQSEEKANQQFRKNQIKVRNRWSNRSGGAKAGTMTKSLIGISILVSLATGLGADRNGIYFAMLFEKWFILDGSMYTAGLLAIKEGQLWRLFTPMFLHFGVMHILFNMMWLYQLGNQIESRLAPVKYLLLCLAISALSNSGQYFWQQIQDVHVPFGGMSGVVYGLLGYMWMKAKYEPEEQYFLHQQTVLIMMIWLVLCMTGLMGNVANAAHLIGLIAGVVFGYARTFLRQMKP